MTEMVERVARALCLADGCVPDDLEPGDVLGIDGHMRNGDPAHFLWRQWGGRARAAIEAMKGLPDDLAAIVAFGNYTEYSYGGDDGSFEYFSAENAKQVWDDLIDAALSRPTPEKDPK